MQTYSLKGIQSMLGLSRAVVTQLVAAGFVKPTRGKRREYRFTFQDVVLLRTALALRGAKIPARRIVSSLRHLKASLPAELPLTGLRITAVGNEVAVREGGRHWDAESGQLLFDFEMVPADEPRGGRSSAPETKTGAIISVPAATGSATPALSVPAAVITITPAAGGSAPSLISVGPALATPAAGGSAADARELFDRAVAAEQRAPAQSERLYREAIALAPALVDAYLNLGVLLIDAGRSAEAVRLYRQALRHCGDDQPMLHYNLGVAHDELNQTAPALACYERSLQLSPSLADAHYNAARLHEQLGHAVQAIRHYSAYRRLQR